MRSTYRSPQANIENPGGIYIDKKEDATHLLINSKVGGIGSNSCGPRPLPQHLFEDPEINLTYRISLA